MSDDRSTHDGADPGGEGDKDATQPTLPGTDHEVDRRTVLMAVPALGVAAAGWYAAYDVATNGGGDDADSGGEPTETPFGYGGTRTDFSGSDTATGARCLRARPAAARGCR